MDKWSKYFIVFGFFIATGLLSFFLYAHASGSQRYSLPGLATPFLVPQAVPPTEEQQPITIIFAGDIMLDRSIRSKALQFGYEYLISPSLSDLLQKADIVVANLEGPITNNPSISVGSEVGSRNNYIFTFAPESASFLANKNINLVNLGNNHILNFGPAGLESTYQYLDQAGVAYFGYTGIDQPATKYIKIIDKNGYKIGFVNYNQFIWQGEEQAFTDLATVSSEADYVIMYTHWGNEYVPENQVLIDLAHTFIDAGADMIIGSHPHVITGNEIYQGKPIYYSLGNFIFDQYFDEQVKKGLLLEASISPETNQATISEYYVELTPAGYTNLIEQN